MNKKKGNDDRKRQSKITWEAKKKEIKYLYFERRLSQAKMAKYFNISQAWMSKIMIRLGIKSRGNGRSGDENGRYKDGKSSRPYRLVITKDKCKACGVTEDLGIHHKNGDHYDNRLENLEVLCNSCHMSKTKRLWWKAKKEGTPSPKGNGPVGWALRPSKKATKRDVSIKEHEAGQKSLFDVE